MSFYRQELGESGEEELPVNRKWPTEEPDSGANRRKRKLVVIKGKQRHGSASQEVPQQPGPMTKVWFMVTWSSPDCKLHENFKKFEE